MTIDTLARWLLEPLDRMIDELDVRIQGFLRAQEAERQKKARRAAEAEEAARVASLKAESGTADDIAIAKSLEARADRMAVKVLEAEPEKVAGTRKAVLEMARGNTPNGGTASWYVEDLDGNEVYRWQVRR